jgi:hypothetical protein
VTIGGPCHRPPVYHRHRAPLRLRGEPATAPPPYRAAAPFGRYLGSALPVPAVGSVTRWIQASSRRPQAAFRTAANDGTRWPLGRCGLAPARRGDATCLAVRGAAVDRTAGLPTSGTRDFAALPPTRHRTSARRPPRVDSRALAAEDVRDAFVCRTQRPAVGEWPRRGHPPTNPWPSSCAAAPRHGL